MSEWVEPDFAGFAGGYDLNSRTLEFAHIRSTETVIRSACFRILGLAFSLSIDTRCNPSPAYRVNAGYVAQRLEKITEDEDLSKFIL